MDDVRSQLFSLPLSFLLSSLSRCIVNCCKCLSRAISMYFNVHVHVHTLRNHLIYFENFTVKRSLIRFFSQLVRKSKIYLLFFCLKKKFLFPKSFCKFFGCFKKKIHSKKNIKFVPNEGD